MSTFSHKIKHRNVHVHSDNTGAEHSVAKGRAKAFDQTCLVHGIWCAMPVCWLCAPSPRHLWVLACRTMALELECGLFVSRVASKENIADDPSRERYSLVKGMGMKFVRPMLHKRFEDAQGWDALSLLCMISARKSELPQCIYID